MLEKPELDDARISACLQEAYGLALAQLAFLPLGADRNTAVYRAVAADGRAYFVKLRRGAFDPLSVALPRFLHEQGIAQIIAPLATRDGALWAALPPFTLVLYPFIEGRDGYQVILTERQWREFGAAIRQLHTLTLPAALAGRVRLESYTPHWRERVKSHLAQLEGGPPYGDRVAAELAALLREKRTLLLDLVGRAEQLAQQLQAQRPPFVLCHSDLHAGNLHLAAPGGAFYIVDWDDPILAPKERDLMYVGGAQGFIGRTAAEEEVLFYQGYGETQVDPAGLAYYRYERIVQDMAIYCQQLLASGDGGADREQSLHYLQSNFLPAGTIEIAYRSDRTQGDSGRHVPDTRGEP